MGEAARHERLSHARSRLAAYSHAARSLVKDLAADSRGATSIEYALIASLISIVIVTAVSSIGTTLFGFYASITSTP
jgi:pilus assembly protein Flp/PilA